MNASGNFFVFELLIILALSIIVISNKHVEKYQKKNRYAGIAHCNAIDIPVRVRGQG